MKKFTLLLAASLAVALLMTGCFAGTEPMPTATPTSTVAPTATDAPTDAPTAAPAATDMPTNAPAASDGLEVAPSPSASTAP